MWYYELNGAQQGPEETEKIQQRSRNGELSPGTLVWREGMTDWTPLSQVPELQQGSVAAPVPQSPSGPYAAPQQMQGPPGAGTMPHQNGLALTSMILGICSLVLSSITCGITSVLAIPAVILGHISRKQIKEAAPMQTGDGLALTGLITGYIMIALIIVGVIVAILSETGVLG